MSKMAPRLVVFVLAASALVVGSAPPAAYGCSDDSWPWCPCQWKGPDVQVYALTVGTSSRLLQNLTPYRSTAEWEGIITNALNIYREHAGIPLRLRFAGHVDDGFPGGNAIVVQAKMMTIGLPAPCDGNAAHASWSAEIPPGNSIHSGDIFLHDSRISNGSCQTIYWDPHLGLQVGTNHDPVNLLIHEIGHTLGLQHPDDFCSEPDIAAVMNSSSPTWSRHLARNDKQSLFERYGHQLPVGKTWSYNDLNNSWLVMADWPASTNFVKQRPFSIATWDGGSRVVAWGTPSWGSVRATHNSIPDTWTSIVVTNPLGWGRDPPTPPWLFSSPAVASAGDGEVRVFFWNEESEVDRPERVKKLCYSESVDYGASWGAMVCPRLANPIGDYVQSHRDGVGAAFDWQTRNYLVVYNEDGPGDCNPGPLPAGCNRIRGLTLPASGSVLTTVERWEPAFADASFSTPSVTCRNMTADDRCIVAWSTQEVFPQLRWAEGAITASSGQWAQVALRAQPGLRLDQSPSVVWTDYDRRFHLATHRRDGDVSRLDTYYKNHVPNASWDGQFTYSSDVASFSAAALSDGAGVVPHLPKLYFLRYGE